MGKFIALITLGCFSVLAWYSIGKYHPDAKPPRPVATVAQPVELRVPTSYTIQQRKGMNKLVGEFEKERENREKLMALFNAEPVQQ